MNACSRTARRNHARTSACLRGWQICPRTPVSRSSFTWAANGAQALHVVDVPIRLVDDFLALPSVEHGRDPLRSVDLRQDASSSGVAGGYTARVAAAARCHGFKSSISPCAALRGERAPTDASARATRERP